MTDTTTSIAPLVREVLVSTDAEAAFRLFTDRIGDWWPLATHSVYGEQAAVAFEDGLLVERSGPDSTTWGEVLDWDPPRSLRVTWHPGHDAAEATTVTVRFLPADDGTTLVRLTHTGWERRTRDGVRATYASGWTLVLGRYAAAV